MDLTGTNLLEWTPLRVSRASRLSAKLDHIFPNDGVAYLPCKSVGSKSVSSTRPRLMSGKDDKLAGRPTRFHFDVGLDDLVQPVGPVDRHVGVACGYGVEELLQDRRR